jgi:chloramphenicol-sensitive protein RarD
LSDSNFQPATDLNGLYAGVGAYLLWGVFPIYFKLVGAVPYFEILAHRIVWTFFLLFPIVLWRKELGKTLLILKNRKTLFILMFAGLLLSINWTIFIWAVGNDRVLDSSLGYFINPLVSVLFGYLILKESLNRPQVIAIVLAALGVIVQAWLLGSVPIVSLVLAFSFGLYGLLLKIIKVPALPGLLIVSAFLSIFAFTYLTIINLTGGGTFLAGQVDLNLLIPLSGVVTASPLLLFGMSANRLTLATLGLIQFIVPTCHFLLAVLVYGEAFSFGHLISFAFIWAGVAVFCMDILRKNRVRI